MVNESDSSRFGNSLAARWRGLGEKDRKLLIKLAVFLLVGIVLMNISWFSRDKSSDLPAVSETAASSATEDADDLARELETILSAIKGAGQVRVVVYYSESAEKVYAMESENDSKSSSGSDDSSTSTSVSSVLAAVNDAPVLIKQYQPRVQGVVVVADGAGDILVKERIYKAVKSLLGLSAGEIAIVEGERSE